MTPEFREELVEQFTKEKEIHLNLANTLSEERLLEELEHVYNLYYHKRMQSKSFNDSLIDLGHVDIVEKELELSGRLTEY